MAVALIVILILFLCWPAIMRWLRNYMARRAEDILRNAAGMPPRPGSREAKRQARRQNDRQSSSSTRGNRRARAYHTDSDEPIIPREYAEDVEFVETKDYSSDTIDSTDEAGRQSMRYHESQVSDVEWEEIKVKSRKKN